VAHKNPGSSNYRTINSGGMTMTVDKPPRLVALDKKLGLVAAAVGKSKGEIVADALEAYLPGKWEEIMRAYKNNE
jgi:hypothetical protein